MKYILFCCFSVFVLVGCNNESKPVETTKEPAVGMANPASVYCEKIGGKSEIKSSPEGQYGMCTLPSGEQIEEWALYRRDHKQTN